MNPTDKLENKRWTLTEVLLALTALFLGWTASQVFQNSVMISAIQQQQLEQDRRLEKIEHEL